MITFIVGMVGSGIIFVLLSIDETLKKINKNLEERK